MKGFFSATSILLAITIIALAASVATLEQSHSSSQVVKLRNEIAFEKFQDAIEIASDSSTHVIASAGKQYACNGINFEDDLNAKSVFISNAVENENLSATIDNLLLTSNGVNPPFTIDVTGDLTTTLEGAVITKQLQIHKKLNVIQALPDVTLNVSDLNTGQYHEFLITC